MKCKRYYSVCEVGRSPLLELVQTEQQGAFFNEQDQFHDERDHRMRLPGIAFFDIMKSEKDGR